MKNVIILLIITIFSSCGIFQKDNISKNEIDTNKKSPTNVEFQDSITYWSCNEYSLDLRIKNLDWVHFKDDLYKCLLKEGFNGNNEANRQIAEIIKIKKLDGFGQFFTRHPKFRGPEVFEAILELTDNIEPSYSADGEFSGRTKGLKFSSFYREMVLHIDGVESISEYVRQKSGMSPLEWVDKFDDYDDLTLCAEESKLTYKYVSEAWVKGLIVLKDYGVE